MSAERTIAAAMGSAITAKVVRPFLLFEGDFSSGFARYWTGYGTLSWGGYSWGGLGHLVKVSDVAESVEMSAKGFSIELSGQSSADLALALTACAASQGRPGKMYLGALDAAGAVIADPILLRRAKLDVAGGSDEGETATITVTYEDRMSDLERAKEFRYTTESQALFVPGDLGFEFVPSLQDAVDVWHP